MRMKFYVTTKGMQNRIKARNISAIFCIFKEIDSYSFVIFEIVKKWNNLYIVFERNVGHSGWNEVECQARVPVVRKFRHKNRPE